MHTLVVGSGRLSADILSRAVQAFDPAATVCKHVSAIVTLQYLRANPVDLAVLDTETTDLDGLDYIPEINQARLARFTVVAVGRRDERTLSVLHRASCQWLVDSLSDDLDRFQTALDAVTSGRRYISDSLQDLLGRTPSTYHPNVLSRYEEAVLCLFGEGLDNQEVAARLHCSSETIRTHRANIMKKLGLHHRGELIRYALAQSYVRYSPSRVLHPGCERILNGEPGALTRSRSSFAGWGPEFPAAVGLTSTVS